MNVAFIGLGNMGAAIARNLLHAGNQLTVYNRTAEKMKPLLSEGARAAASPADACRDAEVVLTMLADDAALEQTVFGENGIAGALKKDAIHVSHSTISTALARRLASEHATRRQGYLSAPVFGRPDAAESKRLIVVTAGPDKLIERCRPLFDAIGRQTNIVGNEAWQANAAKLCGNFMIAGMLESFAEAFATLRKSNVQPTVFLDIMNALFASPVYANYGRIMVEEKFEPAGFALRLGLKDVHLALATADECASPMPIASAIHDRLLSGLAQGHGDKDWSVLAKIAARAAGLE